MTAAFETVSSGRTPSPVEPLPHQLLAVLGRHRMATTNQLHELLRPGTARQTVSAPLNKLRRDGLVDYTVLPQSNRSRAWYLTSEGARLTKNFPSLRGRPAYPINSATAASLKTPHTLTVLRSHLAFVTDARRHGDEHGHLDWTPEVSHPLSDGERIITDAVMHYTHIDGGERTKLRAFVEVDRATMGSERLASKLIEYARLWSYEPQPVGRPRSRQPATAGTVWLRWYPVFPRVLFVLTGTSRYVLDNRIKSSGPWSRSTPSSATWPGRSPWAHQSWKTSRTGGPPVTSGRLWPAANHGHGPSCDSSRSAANGRRQATPMPVPPSARRATRTRNRGGRSVLCIPFQPHHSRRPQQSHGSHYA